ncbi:putative response regulator (CheY homolog) [Modestobacter italicus]|uniref:Response regulator (CheY homolog) n=1 Tax=Modestobacter italicus (strain DSM 44449 / CECT 9708 / BC 501) TaxID=2732864 RepID=I4EUM7_MODI5|nr:response regulator transcription factor [Modestobacter marinus]CCH87090.1 putative response regulator (CheY homolog) [Modestobacter marinus]
MIRVLVVDDHQTVRAAVLQLLASTDGLSVVGEARDGRQALELAELVAPDVVLMDLTMPNMSGIEATRRLTGEHPEARVLIFSAAVGRDVVRAAREAGAVGFLPKGSREAKLIRAIREVGAGRSAWPTWVKHVR